MLIEAVPNMVPVLAPHFPRDLRFFRAIRLEADPEACCWRILLQHHIQKNSYMQLRLRWADEQKLIISVIVRNVAHASRAQDLTNALVRVMENPLMQNGSRECQVTYDMLEEGSSISVRMRCWIQISGVMMQVFRESGSFSSSQVNMFFSWMDPFMDKISICGGLIYNLSAEMKALAPSLN